MKSVNSTCPYCGVGCGVRVEGLETTNFRVVGDEQHPANFGRLCSKGSALGETLVKQNQGARLVYPSIEGEPVSWDLATQTIADKLNDCIEQHGPDSVAFYLSGQLLTEDYYVANKLMKGVIGSANVDTNSRLCMASAVAGYKRSFGADAVPCSYEDIDHADLIVLIGSNAAWTHPVLYQRMVAAKESNPNLKIVLIDPRETASCDIADMHLPIAPSSDGFLFQGLLKYLVDTSSTNEQYIAKYTDGFDSVIESLKGVKMDDIVASCDVKKDMLIEFYEWFAETDKTISFYSQGINQSATGTDKCNAIINCHLASGKIGYDGAGPFSITGQPNAMGGREVGGLANQLAAHMDFAEQDKDRVQRFWQSPNIAQQPGLKAVDLFDAIDDGRVKFVWIMATNPAVSLPDSNKVRRALEKCPTVVVSDVVNTDTSRYANIRLPAKSWSEKDGTVTNSERRISRQRGFKKAPVNAKPDWWALAKVASNMGYQALFDYQSAHQIFIEHARLSGFENDGSRAFDISALSELSPEQYDELKPTQWPINTENAEGTARLFTDNQFFTENRRARFIAATPRLVSSVQTRFEQQDFVLNTGRLRDQWHTMTRTGYVDRLNSHDDVPFVEMNPQDAQASQLKDLDMVCLSNDLGEFVAQLRVSDRVQPKELFSPIHWNDQFAKNAVITAVVSDEVDPVSGQPQLKASAVSISKVENYDWLRIASTQALDTNEFDYWASTKTARGYVTLVGMKNDKDSAFDWREWCSVNSSIDASVTHYSAPSGSQESLMVTNDESIEMLLYRHELARDLPSFTWLATSFEQNDAAQMSRLIRSEQGEPDVTICACFGISKKRINKSIKEGTTDIVSLGAQLGCGSKCGSCKPELASLLRG